MERKAERKGINSKPQKPLLDDAFPDLRSEVDPLLVLLIIPFPKYSAMTENPSLEFLTCWKNLS